VALQSLRISQSIPLISTELGVTEHIEGDECKIAIWTGRSPMLSDYRVVLKANSLEVKQLWVKKLREVIQETYFSNASLSMLKSPAKSANKTSRFSKDMDEPLNDNDQDGSSLASFGSGNTTDSEKTKNTDVTTVLADFHGTPGTLQISVTKGQHVEILQSDCPETPDFCFVRICENGKDTTPETDGLVPISILKSHPANTKNSKAHSLHKQPAEAEQTGMLCEVKLNFGFKGILI
jgi:triple functional domain protein